MHFAYSDWFTQSWLSAHIPKLNVFAGKRYFSLNRAKKRRKKLFCGKFGSTPTFRSTRKGKKCFFLWLAYVCLTTRYYTTSHLHQVFCRFRSDFLAFFARISYFKFLEFKEFNETIIPFALVGHETGYSQHVYAPRWLLTVFTIP